MTEIQIGSHALIIKSKFPEEVGRAVKALDFVEDSGWFCADDGVDYRYRTSKGYGILCRGNISLGTRPFPPEWLMPLSGFIEDLQEVP